jgi:hypothetical protein
MVLVTLCDLDPQISTIFAQKPFDKNRAQGQIILTERHAAESHEIDSCLPSRQYHKIQHGSSLNIRNSHCVSLWPPKAAPPFHGAQAVSSTPVPSKLLLMRSRSGKSSIVNVVLYKLPPTETVFIPTTVVIKKHAL